MSHDISQPPIKAIILSAGQGKRLLPLTRDCPKSLLTVAGKSILEWQIDYLLAAGVENISIVTGFGTDRVESVVRERYPGHSGIQTLFNPFYNLSDNLASCWIAAGEMDSDFILLNGDTLFERALLEKVLASEPAPITLTVDQKDQYDEDDMKVEMNGELVAHVSKTLPAERIHAESIGLLYFRRNGPSLFRAAVDQCLRDPAGLKSWYLTVVDSLAGQGLVRPCGINGRRWAEIDDKQDLEHAHVLFSDVMRGEKDASGEAQSEILHRSSA